MALNERLAIFIDASTAGAVKGLKDVAKASDDLANATGKSEKQLKLLEARSAQASQTLKTGLSVAAGVAGAGLLAAFAKAAGAAADFDKAMSGVKAVAGATGAQMDQLRTAALQAGKDTAFSATQAAAAEAELAKAGVSVKDILGGALTGALSLAAAGQIELADAATLAAQAMNVFNLRGSDVGHIADVLASAANKSAADIGTLGDALRQGGLVAKQSGLSLEETVGALALFADNALVGSDAGTSLKTALQRLVPQSDKARQAMEDIGFSAFDANGNFKSLDEIAGDLQEGMRGLSEAERAAALNTIFGSDAVRAASILYEAGEKGVRKYTKSVNDNGAAARMAATQMDNLAGDLEQLRGSIETALIGSGSGANTVLRTMTQTTNSLVGEFLDLPGPMQAAAGALAGIGGAALTAVGVFGVMKPKIDEARKALEAMGPAGTKASGALGAIGKASAYAAAAVVVIGALEVATDELGDAIFGTAGSLAKVTDDLVRYQQTAKLGHTLTKMFGDDMNQLGHAIERVVEEQNPIPFFGHIAENVAGVTAASKKVDAIDKSLANLVRSGNAKVANDLFAEITTHAKGSGVSVGQLTKVFNEYQDALAEARTQQRLAGGAAGNAADDIGAVGVALDAASVAAQAFQNRAVPATISGKSLFGVLSEIDDGLAAILTQDFDDAAKKEFLKPFEAMGDQIRDALDIGGIWKDLDIAPKDLNAAKLKARQAANAVTRAERDLAEARKKATPDALEISDAEIALEKARADAADATKEFADAQKGAGGSLSDFSKKLDENLKHVEQWRTDLNKVAERGGYEFAHQLEELGPQAAGLVGKIATASQPEFDKLREQFRKAAEYASVDFAIAMTLGMKAIPIIASSAGKLSAEAIATSIGANTPQVVAMIEEMARQIGVTLAQNPAEVNVAVNSSGLINSITAALTGVSFGVAVTPRVSSDPTKGADRRADGAVVQYFAAGGMNENHVAQIARAGQMRVWAEPETGGEAYIPLAASKRPRSAQVLAETARRMGYQIVPMAAGGINNAGSATPAGMPTSHQTIVQVGEVRPNNFDDFVRQMESRARMNSLVGL